MTDQLFRSSVVFPSLPGLQASVCTCAHADDARVARPSVAGRESERGIDTTRFTPARCSLPPTPAWMGGWVHMWMERRIQSHPCRFPNGKKRGSVVGTEDGVSGCEGCVIREPWGFLFLFRGFSFGPTGMDGNWGWMGWSKRSEMGGVHGGCEFRTGASMWMGVCLACLLVKGGGTRRRRCLPFMFGWCRATQGGGGVTRREEWDGSGHRCGQVAFLTEMDMLCFRFGG